MIRLLFILAIVGVLAFCGATVPLGKKTFLGHVKAIWSSEPMNELKDGVKEELKEAKPKERAHVVSAPRRGLSLNDVSIGAPAVSGSLASDVIRRIVRRHNAQIRSCYEKELTRAPALKGKIVVKFVVGGNGTVSQAAVGSSDMGSAVVEACVVSQVKTWAFPSPEGGGSVVVSYPFNFTTSQ
jgi:TonB family protein